MSFVKTRPRSQASPISRGLRSKRCEHLVLTIKCPYHETSLKPTLLIFVLLFLFDHNLFFDVHQQKITDDCWNSKQSQTWEWNSLLKSQLNTTSLLENGFYIGHHLMVQHKVRVGLLKPKTLRPTHILDINFDKNWEGVQKAETQFGHLCWS